jgi:hypothetical protein
MTELRAGFPAMSLRACSAIPDASIAKTRLAPACTIATNRKEEWWPHVTSLLPIQNSKSMFKIVDGTINQHIKINFSKQYR